MTFSVDVCVLRSLDYGHTFANDTSKWDDDTVIEWYYISPHSEYVSDSILLKLRISGVPLSVVDLY